MNLLMYSDFILKFFSMPKERYATYFSGCTCMSGCARDRVCMIRLAICRNRLQCGDDGAPSPNGICVSVCVSYDVANV